MGEARAESRKIAGNNTKASMKSDDLPRMHGTPPRASISLHPDMRRSQASQIGLGCHAEGCHAKNGRKGALVFVAVMELRNVLMIVSEGLVVMHVSVRFPIQGLSIVKMIMMSVVKMEVLVF